MGRKSKKRVTQQVRTPMRTSTILPPKEAASMSTPTHPAPAPEAPLIDMETPSAPEPDSMPMATSPQLSPPPSPISEDVPAPPRQPEPIPRSPSPVRRMDSFVRIDSPPSSPHLSPSSPVRRASGRRKQAATRNTRQNHGSFEVYGANPHVVACVSCNDFCTLTGTRGIVEKHELGLDDANDDTFFPTVCSSCENYRGFMWLKLEGGRSPPGQRQQYPETLHSSMLAAWPLYTAVRERFGVSFDPDVHQHTATVTRSRDWWREGVLTHDKSLVLMWHYDTERRTMYEKSPMPRKDEFFGGPQR